MRSLVMMVDCSASAPTDRDWFQRCAPAQPALSEVPFLERQKLISTTLILLTLVQLLYLLRFPLQASSTEMGNVLWQEQAAIPTRHGVSRLKS